jgi:hypothetical protein
VLACQKDMSIREGNAKGIGGLSRLARGLWRVFLRKYAASNRATERGDSQAGCTYNAAPETK